MFLLDTPPQERAPIGETDLVLKEICALPGKTVSKSAS